MNLLVVYDICSYNITSFLNDHEQYLLLYSIGLETPKPMTTLQLKSFERASRTQANLEAAKVRQCGICKEKFNGGFCKVFGVYGHWECVRFNLVCLTEKEPDSFFRRIFRENIPTIWTNWVWNEKTNLLSDDKTFEGFLESDRFEQSIEEEETKNKLKRKAYYEENKERLKIQRIEKREKERYYEKMRHEYPHVYELLGSSFDRTHGSVIIWIHEHWDPVSRLSPNKVKNWSFGAKVDNLGGYCTTCLKSKRGECEKCRECCGNKQCFHYIERMRKKQKFREIIMRRREIIMMSLEDRKDEDRKEEQRYKQCQHEHCRNSAPKSCVSCRLHCDGSCKKKRHKK